MSCNLKLIITRPAYNDMQQIFEYIAKDNKIAAAKLLDIFEQSFDRILTFPNCGFKPTFSNKNIKVFIVAKHYQIVYTIKDNNLYVQRILTGYQNICNLKI